MRKKPRKYTKSEKLDLLRRYHESGMSKMRFARENGLSNSTLINLWIRQYESAEESLTLPSDQPEEEMARKSKEQLKEDNDRLRRRVRELEKALEVSRLETEARDLMIDLAEERFEIPIRKKCGAKR